MKPIVCALGLLLLVVPGGRSEPPNVEGPAPRLALLVDDFGYSLGATARGFLEMEETFSISVIPGLRHSTEIAGMARAAGKELLVHLPMEPLEYPERNPGEGALFVQAPEDTLRQRTGRALSAVPGAAGVNNHMGSRAMQDEELLRIVMAEVKKRSLFFLDSKTVAGRTPMRIARSMGVPFAESDLFWDTGYDTIEEILEKLDRLAEIARQRGYAIGIGHPRPVTLDALRAKLPDFEKQGIRLVTISDLIRSEFPTGAAKQGGPGSS